MELRQLEYFAAVVRHGHFGRAAEDVYITQSALSQQIRRLEEELGLTLLLRTSKGVELTPAGVEFIEHAQAILGRVAAARAAIDEHVGAVRGVARVAATVHDARALPEALVSFHRVYPGVQLALRHGSAGQVVALLGSGVVDVGIVGVHDNEPKIPPGVTARAISEEPLCIVCAPLNPLAGTRAATIDELRGAPVILPERGTALREVIASSCGNAGFSPLPLFETSDPRTIRYLAGSGLAIGAIPRSWLEDDGPQVGVAEFAEPAPRYRVALLSTTDGRLPVRQLLVEHLTRFFDAMP
jgi:DNA-binding transcriptional LysR family regulator